MKKIHSFSERKKKYESFAKLFKALKNSKELHEKSVAFNKLKMPVIHQRGVERNMDKLNEILHPQNSASTRRESKSNSFSSSILNGDSRVSIGSRSNSRVKEQEKRNSHTLQ